MNIRLILLILSFVFNSSIYAGVKKNFLVATWNLEHATSKEEFEDWVRLCEPLNWDEPDNRDQQYPNKIHLPYCNALNGEKYPPPTNTNPIESLPVHSVTEWLQKVSQSKSTLAMVEPDIIALQEVSSKKAVESVVGEDYEVFFLKAQRVKQQLAFAVKKVAMDRYITDIQVELLSELSIEHEGHKVRPGLILSLKIHNRPYTFLNLHLKSGCSTYPISRPDTDDEDKVNNCKTFSKQLPILETWIEEHAAQSIIVLGDFNRSTHFDYKIYPTRLDGESPQAAHTIETRYGSFYQEISDGSPYDADLVQIPTSQVSGVSGCRFGIDHILFNRYLLEREQMDSKYLQATSLPFNIGKTPVANEVKTSDHCMVVTTLPVEPATRVKDVHSLSTQNVINIASFESFPVSTLLYGYSDTDPKIFIKKEDCNATGNSDTLACFLLREQSRTFTPLSSIEDIQSFIADKFTSKIQYIVDAESMRDFHTFLLNKGPLSTALLNSGEYLYEGTSTGGASSLGVYIRPLIIQSSSGIGVSVKLTPQANVYNIGIKRQLTCPVRVN